MTIEFTNDDIKRLVLKELERLLPNTEIKPGCLIFDSKSAKLDTWEVTYVRFRYIDSHF